MVKLAKKTLPALIDAVDNEYNQKPALAVFGEQGVYNKHSYAEFAGRCRYFAAFLQQLGIKKGDRVMLLAENSPEWVIAYFGIALAEAISVPILTDFPSQSIATVASHAGIAAICATAKTLPGIKSAGLDTALPVIRLDSFVNNSIKVETAGSETTLVTDQTRDAFRQPETEEDDTASIIYTSGTTGNSKGVMLSHLNIIFDAQACRSIIKVYPRDRFLSVLPLAHSYECTIGMIIAVVNGASVTYLDKPPAPAALLPALKAIRPSVMLTVPLIMEKIYRNKVGPALAEHPLYKMPLTRKLAVRAAGRKLLGTFGGAIRFFGIGGAPLAPDVERFLKEARFPYAIGYGLTETAPLLAGAPPNKTVLKSTGPALEGVQLRVVDKEGKVVGGTGAPSNAPEHAEGEIQAFGPNVMKGYYKDPVRTAEVFTQDHWFKTGDLGSFDRKGRLFIRGRLKAMILGPSGENIYPEEIESVLNASEMIEDSLVYAGEKGELVALVVISEKAQTMLAAAGDALHEAGQSAGAKLHQVAQAMGSAAHQAGNLLDGIRKNANTRLARFSRIERIEIQDEPFEKTATHKIKRFLYPKKKDR